MRVSFMDVMKTVAPIAVAFIPGIGVPAAIALSAAMKGGTTAAEGGSWKEIARDAAIGGATGAAGIGISQGVGKMMGKASEKLTEGVFEKATQAMTDTGGMQGVIKGVEIMSKGSPTGEILGKVGTKLASVGADAKSQGVLDLAKKTGKAAGVIDQTVDMFSPDQQPPSFLEVQGMMHQGMGPDYQFGAGRRRSRYGTATVGSY